jgi:hypothetical protein
MPRIHWRLGLTSLLCLAAATVSGQQAGDVRAAAPGPPPEGVGTLPEGPGLEAFSGLWDYNAAESLDVATKRPEQDPSAARRSTPGATGRVVGQPPPRARAGGSAGDTGGGLGGFGAGTDDPAREQAKRYRQQLAAENRALVRDLMEVPETLKITSSTSSVTMTDDLERSLTFPTDMTKRKYQLSASTFDATARWDGRKLVKDIEGPRGFRLSETYFLSQDGQRLFVIVRLGEGKPDEPAVGANRVYDRVERTPAGGGARSTEESER